MPEARPLTTPLESAKTAMFIFATAPPPPVWPDQFHAVCLQNRSGHLALTDLWYDFPGGRNANIIHRQLGSTTYDIEWTNGTSFFFSDQGGGCRMLHFDVGILRPDWLSGGQYVGRREKDGFACDVWTKAEFITYYADVKTGRPVFWQFLGSGAEFHILRFEEGAVLGAEGWQAPAACFESGGTAALQVEGHSLLAELRGRTI
ncbi:hypothetical protein KFL_001240075 [Klebsormidium nitens]|uniref:Uncharacterized protein n=1 Tax=Klebsormidium nitens TaxID=105231 RepID=A0A1Y1I201_KLENI|nr:hypothetical protein KFL_001240075 [Klebsormidium nitens]|eukprot:GAQ82776.1 hypothetical protein KFL_001240075 [Klebsormidium nitens]